MKTKYMLMLFKWDLITKFNELVNLKEQAALIFHQILGTIFLLLSQCFTI